MAFDEFDYERKWTDPEDFPTYEYDEGTVRADMQALFDEIRDAFNDFAVQADADITELQGAIDDIEAGQVPDGSIDEDKLAENSVESRHIVDGTIVNEDIADNTIQPGKLVEGSIPGSGIANVTSRIRAGSIAATEIKDKTITPAKLENANSSGTTGIPGSGISGTTSKIRRKSIGTSDIKNSAVTGDLIANGAVVEGKLAASAVTTGKILDGAVTTGKIADGAVTKEKLAPELVNELQGDEVITARMIRDGAVSKHHAFSVNKDNWVAAGNLGFKYEITYSSVGFTTRADVFIDVRLDSFILPENMERINECIEAFSHVYFAEVPEDNKLVLYADEAPDTTFSINTVAIGK